MKPFDCRVEIAASRQKVVDYWQDPDRLQYWQKGFIGMDHVSGEKGKAGAVSIMRYKVMGGRKEIELKETILISALPDQFKGSYAGEAMTNTMDNYFEDTDTGTEWRATVHYHDVNGFMPKLMMKLMPGMFRKQVQSWMNAFKEFVESDSSD